MSEVEKILNSQEIANFAVNRPGFPNEQNRNILRGTLKKMIDEHAEHYHKTQIEKNIRDWLIYKIEKKAKAENRSLLNMIETILLNADKVGII